MALLKTLSHLQTKLCELFEQSLSLEQTCLRQILHVLAVCSHEWLKLALDFFENEITLFAKDAHMTHENKVFS